MALSSGTKINKLLQLWLPGTVALTGWLKEQGISSALLQHYEKTGWLESLGRGAFQRAGERVEWPGGLYALQKQAGLHIHVGGRTALGMQGQAHYLELDAKTVTLFASSRVTVPAWFQRHDWGVRPDICHTDFLPPETGLVPVESKQFFVKASGAARALMECLSLTPQRFELAEAYQIMEGLNGLRPDTVQALLEECRSVKVKRLFLFLAERAGHAWFRHLEVAKIGMGHGTRSLAERGAYVSKYRITVPQELADV